MFVGFKVYNGECTENFKNQNIETAACISFLFLAQVLNKKWGQGYEKEVVQISLFK